MADRRRRPGPIGCPTSSWAAPARSSRCSALADAFDDPALIERRVRDRRRADRPPPRVTPPRLVVGDPRPAPPRIISAGSRTARRASAGRCSSCSPRPATSGSARARWARSSTSARGSTRTRARGPTCASAASGAARRGGSRSPAVRHAGAHGEAGIALTRLRAHRACSVLRRTQARRRARARRRLAASSRERCRTRSTTSRLCHGAAGAADVLLCGAAASAGDGARRQAGRRARTRRPRAPRRNGRRLAVRRGRRARHRAFPRAQRDRLVVPAPARRDDPSPLTMPIAVDTRHMRGRRFVRSGQRRPRTQEVSAMADDSSSTRRAACEGTAARTPSAQVGRRPDPRCRLQAARAAAATLQDELPPVVTLPRHPTFRRSFLSSASAAETIQQPGGTTWRLLYLD